jgi:hypothetical protein
MFNPIIPVCKTMPAAWRQDHFREITRPGLADAYIKFFEPDVFVEAEPGLAKEAGVATANKFLTEHIIPFQQFARSGRRHPDFASGLSAIDVYRDLYNKEFKFTSRHPPKVAIFEDADPFCEAVFGGFSLAKELAHIKKAFMRICEPEIFAPTAEACAKTFKDHYLTPIVASNHDLNVNFENRDDPTIFAFDPHKTVDLIDFWNLRQFRSSVMPINIHWFAQFENVFREFVTKNFRPLPGNASGVMITTTLEFGRSIGKVARENLTAAHFKDVPAGSVSRKDWHDPIWRTDWRNGGIQPRRAKIFAKETDIEEAIAEPEPTLRLSSLAPNFASQYSFANNRSRWVNVVKLTDYGAQNSPFALTFPPNVKGEDFPRLDVSGRSLCTREGIVQFKQFKTNRSGLRLITQKKAVMGWLKSRGIEAKPSSSGRNAEQVVRADGGIRGSSIFADEETVKLLNKIVKTIQREADGTTAQYPDWTASVEEWREVIGRRSKAPFSSAKLEDFSESKVMRIGLSLKCPLCAKENWYSLTDVDYEITCERCLDKFPFPQAGIKFNEGDWRYRILGPFSVPNYADGAYSTILTLRLFSCLLGVSDTPTTFATGLNVTLGSLKFEIDFAGWYTEGRKFWVDPNLVVLFGEAKSFGSEVFKDRDVQRLKAMAEALQGSFVVFAALKKELSSSEKARIKGFAEWGRVPQKNGDPRAMVIVLTGTELFADHTVEQTWKDLGGAHAKMVQHPTVHLDDLWTLADITQQLYLSMPAYWDWRRRRKSKRNLS